MECACAEARRAQRLPAECGGAAGSPRGPSQIRAPRLHAAPGARPDGRVFRAAKQARPQPKSRRAVGSRGPERARSGGNHLAQQTLAGCGAVGAPSGGNLTFAPSQRSKHRRKSLRRLGAAAAPRRRVKRAGLAPAWGGADVPKALRGDFHSLVATTANAREAGSRTLFTEPKIALRQKSSRRTFSQIEIGSIDRFSDRVGCDERRCSADGSTKERRGGCCSG